MESITIFTLPTCSKCRVIKMKLERKGYSFEECQDIPTMEKLDIRSTPALRIPTGEILRNFTEINKWVESL